MGLHECYIEDTPKFSFMQKRTMFRSFPESAQNIYSEVSWNKPFKALATEKYDQRLAEEGTNQGI